MPGFADSIPKSASGELVETVNDLSGAAEERYWDALGLATSTAHDSATAAIYLFGYAAELALKTALYDSLGCSGTHDVNQPLSGGNATARGVAQRTLSGTRNFHDLIALDKALLQLSGPPAAGTPGSARRSRISSDIGVLALHWAEWLRYRPERASIAQLEEVHGIVDDLLHVHRAAL